MKLGGRMERFCEEYLADYNASRAAIRAGYSKDNGYKLLKNRRIVERICELQEELVKNRLFDNKNRVISEIWNMYERAMQAKPVTVWDKEIKEYVETGEYQFDDKIAMKCLELIIKLGGNLPEKETEKSEGIEIVVRVAEDED